MGFFLPVSKLFLYLLLYLPLQQKKKKKREGRADRFELSLVTRYLRMSEVFHGCVASARARNPPVLSTGKIARDPTVYFGKYIPGIVGNLLDFFSFFRSKGNVRMMEELIFLKNRNEIRREN